MTKPVKNNTPDWLDIILEDIKHLKYRIDRLERYFTHVQDRWKLVKKEDEHSYHGDKYGEPRETD